MVAEFFVGLMFLLAILLMRLELMTNTLKANLKEKETMSIEFIASG